MHSIVFGHYKILKCESAKLFKKFKIVANSSAVLVLTGHVIKQWAGV